MFEEHEQEACRAFKRICDTMETWPCSSQDLEINIMVKGAKAGFCLEGDVKTGLMYMYVKNLFLRSAIDIAFAQACQKISKRC